jgi:hypothetical protein
MPHCSKMMYANVLKSNWNIKSLDKVLIFGNSFKNYFEELFDNNSFFLIKDHEFWKEIPLILNHNDSKLINIFNNSSLHYFCDISNINFNIDYFKKHIEDNEFV